MYLENIDKSLPWFFKYLENYAHLLLRIKLFQDPQKSTQNVNFNLKVETHGFEGLLFYIYQFRDILKFDILNNPYDTTHKIRDIKYYQKKEDDHFLNIGIVPFGHFKLDDNRLQFKIKVNHIKPDFSLYAWAPSNLFKKLKSIIKINNTYQKLSPVDNEKSSTFKLENWFKANDTGHLFNLINLIADFESNDNVESDLIVNDIKNLINKTNEFLFELSDEEGPIELKGIITEIKRLRNNIYNLSQEKIVEWIDDIIDYYSKKV
jgi:hypothetical protein